MKLARGTTAAATLHHSGWAGWRVARTKWHFRVADVRDGPNKVLISASPSSPYVRVRVRVWGWLDPISKKTQSSGVLYKPRPRTHATLPTPPAMAVVPFGGSSSQAARKSHAVPLMTFLPLSHTPPR